MASRAVGFAASRSAAAADSEATVAMGSRKKTTTTVYKSDGSGGMTQESHTHVESSGSQGRKRDSDIIIMETRYSFSVNPLQKFSKYMY